VLAKDDENSLETFYHRAELNELALTRWRFAVFLVLLGHLGLYTSQRVAPQQLPGVFQAWEVAKVTKKEANLMKLEKESIDKKDGVTRKHGTNLNRAPWSVNHEIVTFRP
jgi:hypothetical protein